MKVKIIFSYLLTCLLTGNLFGQEVIQEFRNSSSFEHFLANPPFEGIGSPNFEEGRVFQKDDGNQLRHEEINIPFYNQNGNFVGMLIAAKLNRSGITLPNGLGYLMMYRDFSQFNIDTKSGIIDVYDINYDNHRIATITTNNTGVVSHEVFPMPSSILESYASVHENNEPIVDQFFGQHPGVTLCDANHNGNVGFFECYKCLNNVCSGDSECMFLCYFVGDALGWKITGWGPLCQYSFAGACVVIAAVY